MEGGAADALQPIPGTDEDLTDYRGSIVDLTPATSYEIQFTLTPALATPGVRGLTRPRKVIDADFTLLEAGRAIAYRSETCRVGSPRFRFTTIPLPPAVTLCVPKKAFTSHRPGRRSPRSRSSTIA